MFVLQAEKLVRPLCHEAVSVIAEHNIRRNFDAKHGAKFSLQVNNRFFQILKGRLKSQQKMLAKAIAKKRQQ